jgi:sugar/nucleoside kinase (ribokinase family)
VTGFVAVVGTVNADRIVGPAGETSESLGGILYNGIVLAALLEGTGLAVRLVARLGADDREEALRLLAPFPAADGTGLIADPAGTNRSVLDYSRAEDRVEEVELRVPPLTAEDLAGVAGARAVLVNLISGRDVTLAALDDLRRRAPRALFLLDIQALARTADSPRRPCPVSDWKEWCARFDVVRGNEVEATHFAGAAPDGPAAVRRLLARGVAEVHVTRGVRGSWLGVASSPATGHRGADGAADGAADDVTLTEIPALPCPGVADPTGCGDAYLSGVCAGRVLGLAPVDAAHLGAFAAARVAGLAGLSALTGLRGLREGAAAASTRFRSLAR